MKLPISARLLACCDYVAPGDRVADVGCDHGYLSIHLLQTGVASHVYASDVRQGPLSSAKRNAASYGVTQDIDFFLADGVQDLPRDFDTLVCAGMGGDTMISILSAAPWLKSDRYRLILQCQSKRPELRQWLAIHGFSIHRETLSKDGKFVYPVMEVIYQPGQQLTPAQTYITPQLLEDNHPLLPEFLARVKRGVELTISGLRHTADPELPLYEAILSDLSAWEGQIHDNRC